MKPGRYNLPIIWRGTDYPSIAFTWLNANGGPIDLTTWVPIALTKDFDLLPVKTDAVNGVTQIGMTKEQTLALALGVYDWNWVFFNPFVDFTTVPLLAGQVEVKEPQTNA